jgi:hypothetical protein
MVSSLLGFTARPYSAGCSAQATSCIGEF